LVSTGKYADVTAAVRESTEAKNDLLVVELTLSNKVDRTLGISPAGFVAIDNDNGSYQVLSPTDYEYVLNQINQNKWQDST